MTDEITQVAESHLAAYGSLLACLLFVAALAAPFVLI